MKLKDLKMDTLEGKLLIAAIGLLMTCKGYQTKTPDDILKVLDTQVEKQVW